MIDDKVGAFMPDGKFTIMPTSKGLLDGLTFAVKDLLHIAGHKTSAGNPTWLDTHGICQETSPVVTQLLENGATCVGKVLTDEMAFSLNGDNIHYGTPINVNAPNRITGGSSNGSAAAIAAKLCDFAIATDTGGSTRVPAGYCGIFGMRTTHGLISTQNMVPLHPSFDTVNWLAYDFDVFQKVGKVLCAKIAAEKFDFKHVKISPTLWQLADDDFQPALQNVTQILASLLQTEIEPCAITKDNEDIDCWRQAYVDFGAFEAWAIHGDWVEKYKPVFSEAIAGRWNYAKTVTSQKNDEAAQKIKAIRRYIDTIITRDTIMVLPTSASVALPIGSAGEAVNNMRIRTMQITCLASICGLPQFSIPLRNKDNLPIGISILGPKNSDLALIEMAKEIMEKL